METYKIIRFYFKSDRAARTIKKGLTLEEAQKHCRDPETSSSTCSKTKTRRCPGKWFDGYTKE